MTRPGTVLLLYHRPTHSWYKDAAAIREHIHSFAKHSRYPVWELNTDFGFPPTLDEVRPGAVILHFSLFGSGEYRLDRRFLAWLRDRPDTLKIAFFQDEFYLCQKRFAFINEYGIDVVFTHVGPKHIADVWGRYTPKARALFNLPGYVDDGVLAAARKYARPDEERDIDVGYRGRPLPAHMGAGSQEKQYIGERFRQFASGTDLRLDIETSIESRIYDDAWHRFLGRTRVTLGVESGVSFIDLEDECHAEYLRLRAALGREPSLEELRLGALSRWDGTIPYRTLGPRHLEAAAFRVCQVLFEGDYSEAMQPMVHYIPLKKDFSNFDDVLAAIRDADLRRQIVDRAYEDLIASGRYSYANFMASVDRELQEGGLRGQVAVGERRELDVALRRGRLKRRARRSVERTVALWRHLLWRVVAPLSLRVRRRLGLSIPSE